MLDLVERAEAIIGIKKGLASMDQGEGVPLENAVQKLRRIHKIPKRA